MWGQKKNGEEDKVGCMIYLFYINIILDEVNYRLLLNVTRDTDASILCGHPECVFNLSKEHSL